MSYVLPFLSDVIHNTVCQMLLDLFLIRFKDAATACQAGRRGLSQLIEEIILLAMARQPPSSVYKTSEKENLATFGIVKPVWQRCAREGLLNPIVHKTLIHF